VRIVASVGMSLPSSIATGRLTSRLASHFHVLDVREVVGESWLECAA